VEVAAILSYNTRILIDKLKGMYRIKTGFNNNARNPYVAELAKRRERGIYQLCVRLGPFNGN